MISILKHIPDNKILIDHFLDRCQEAEVDAIYDGEQIHVMGVMEHIEPAGIHSGDSFSVLPTFNFSENVIQQLLNITQGDMPTVVIDCTGNLKAINNAFSYLSHGARFVMIGLQKNEISISHPEFHKREGTLMSSRNATKEDFQWVMNSMKSGQIQASDFISHRLAFDQVPAEFSGLLDPQNRVIKAMISMD
jgi:threonine dehydrogenase-like Zn-dependent dehydrogenase